MPPRSIEEYQVGWVCALPKEMTAARAMLDEEYVSFKSGNERDNNSYVLGRLGEHNVVMACLPAGVYGTNAAATVANNMLRTFTGIRFGLMVGIGGAIPNVEKEVDIRLGDVVVSQPDKTHGGVVQYDLGKNLGEGNFERKGFLRPPPTVLLTALSNLQSQHDLDGSQIPKFLAEMIKRRPNLVKSGYGCPGPEKDCLFCSHLESLTGNSRCTRCQDGTIQREARDDQHPVVHYGVIASGSALIKNAAERDRLGEALGAKCVEMEAAGLMDEFPCIVIRGICDYADAHKNDVWQKYAATTAAAFAKELLSVVRLTEVAGTKHAADMIKYSLGLNLFDAPDMGAGLFVGRETEMQEMENILQPKSKSPDRRVLNLGGMGGIGKTQLAINYAKQHRDSYSSIFWLNATSEETLNSSLRVVANRILLPATAGKLDDDQLRIEVLNWLSELENFRWLLILDNHDDPDGYKIQEYFPFVAHGSIIITTRLPDRLTGKKIKIRSMKKEEDSLRILATRSGREDTESDAGAFQLAQRLDGFPLALATAGAFLKQTQLTFVEYLQQYDLKWKVSNRRLRALPEYSDRTLYTTWMISFDQIEKEDRQVAQLLMLLAYFDNQNVSYELLHAGTSKSLPAWLIELTNEPGDFADAMSVLSEYCLVETRPGTHSYSIHVCVHDWLLNGIDSTPKEQEQRYSIAFDCIANSIGYDDWDILSGVQYNRIAAHALRLGHTRFISLLSNDDFIAGRTDRIHDIGELLRKQGHHGRAEFMYLRALAGYEKALSPDHTSTLHTVNNLGVLYRDQGRLAEAEQMYLRALAGYEKAPGPDHTSTPHTVNNLGVLYRDQGRLAEAEQMYLRALGGSEKALGPDHTSTLDTVNNLGILYRDQGRLVEAEKMYLRALAGYEKALGPDHTSTLNTVNNLGVLYEDQGRPTEAEKMYLRALAGYEKALGPDHTSTLDTVNNLGLLYRDQGRLAEAEQMFLRALTGKEKALGPDHTSTLETVNNLGVLYRDQGRSAEAEQMYLRALAGKEKALGPDHTSTLNTVNNLGILYRNQGQPAEAEQMYLRALAGYEKALGPDHTSTLDTANNLGILYRGQGRPAEAEQMYLRALGGSEKALGPDHTSTLDTVNNLGVLYRDQGRLAGKGKALGPDHMSTLDTVRNLGKPSADQGKTEQARTMFQRAIVGQTKVRALRHPHTLEVANDLKQLNVEVIRNKNHDSSVDQSPQKRKNGKGKWWQWKGRKTGDS